MNIKKAIKLAKQNMTFGNIMELCDLTHSQMYAVDYGIRNSQSEWKIAKVASQADGDMKATEIEALFYK